MDAPGHRLTAFEFVPASYAPERVQLLKGEEILAEFCVVGWLAVALLPAIVVERKEDLQILGIGMGHPYWDDELPAWLGRPIDPVAEQRRIWETVSAVQAEGRARAIEPVTLITRTAGRPS